MEISQREKPVHLEQDAWPRLTRRLGWGRDAVPLREDTTLFTGYARLPSGITASRVSDVVGVAVEVEPGTGTIVDAECTLSTHLARDFFRRLIIGHSLEADFPSMLRTIERRYHGSAQKALVTALKTVLEKYQSRRQG